MADACFDVDRPAAEDVLPLVCKNAGAECQLDLDAPVHETSPPMPLLSDLPRREDRRKGCAPGFRAARSHTRAAEISTVRVERMKLMMTM